MGLFSKTPPATLTAAFAALGALSGKTGLTADSAKAANEELIAAGVTDAAIITRAEFQDLSAKAARAEAAEGKVTTLTAQVGTLTTAKTDLETKLTASEQEVARLGALGGAAPTTSGKPAGDQVDAPKAHAWFNPEADHNAEAIALLGK